MRMLMGLLAGRPFTLRVGDESLEAADGRVIEPLTRMGTD
jgi:hypothetical protein